MKILILGILTHTVPLISADILSITGLLDMKPSAWAPRLYFGTTPRACRFPRNHWVRRARLHQALVEVLSPFQKTYQILMSAICMCAIWNKYYPWVSINTNFIFQKILFKILCYTPWKAVCNSGFSLQRAYLNSCRMLHTVESFPKSSDDCWSLISWKDLLFQCLEHTFSPPELWGHLYRHQLSGQCPQVQPLILSLHW